MSDQVRILAGDGGSGRPRPPLAVIAAVLAALVVGLALGRVTAPGHDSKPTPRSVAPDPDGQPVRRVGTVGVGYPHTRAGAVAATLNGGAALGDPRVLLNTTQRTRVLEMIATDRYAGTFAGAGAAALDRAAGEPLGRGIRDGAQTISLTSPLAYRVASYSDNAAKVVSWGVAVVGNDQGLAPTATWATTTTTLRWQDGDWKIDTASSTDGPAPGLDGQRPTDASGFISALSGSQGCTMRPDRRRLIGVVLVAATVMLGLGAAAPAPAQADVCDKIPSIPGVPNPVKTGCKVVGKAPEVVTDPGKAVTDIATAPFDAAGDAVMKGVTKWVADGAGWLVGQAGKLIDATTTPRLDSPWFGQQYRAMAALAAVFALPLLLLSVLQSVTRRDSSIAIRAAFVHLPAAFLLTAGAVAVVVMFLQLTDEMCTQVSSSVGSDAGSFFKDTTDALSKLAGATGQGAVPLFAVFLGGLIAAIGAFFVWIELVLRSAAVYVTVLFLPFTFVAMVWPTTARWCRRLVELLFAVIFSKFVIVAIMALAAAGLGQSRSDEAFQGVIAGAALMMLASLSPLVLLRLVPLAEAAAHTNWRSGAGSQTLGPIAGPAATMRRVVDSNWGGMSGGGGLRAAPAAAGAGPAGMATAGAAGAMTGAVRARAGHAGGTGGSTGGGGSPGGDGARYAAVGGGGQAARPAAPSSGQSTPGADSGASTTARPGGAPGQSATPGGRSVPAQRDGRSGAEGGPRPMAPGRDLSGSNPPPQKGGGERGR